MKKVIIAAILLLATGSALQAQNRQGPNNKNNPGYVDTNHNNVCDNYERNTCRQSGTAVINNGNRMNNNAGKGNRRNKVCNGMGRGKRNNN